MARPEAVIELGDGSDGINDAAVDYYGKRLALCSYDGTIKIMPFGGSKPAAASRTTILRGHQGPIWQVAWAHPRYGTVLASCSYASPRVIIWKETSSGTWTQVHAFDEHSASVNSIAWSPHEAGLFLACGSSDGTISVLSPRGSGVAGPWDCKKIEQAHAIGVTAVSWAPTLPPGALVSGPGVPSSPPVVKLASCGCDKTVKVWARQGGGWKLDCFPPLSKHSDWVRDVAWAPNLGLPRTTMASASQDGTVVIWTQEKAGEHWQGKLLHDFGAPVWKVSWSETGMLLAVTVATGEVSLWKEVVDGEWHRVSSV